MATFSADAIIKKTVDRADQTFSDDFNRSVGPGTGTLGGSWVWSDDDARASIAEDDTVYVDGSAVILPPHPISGSGFNYSSWRWGDRPESGTLQFDFWVPSLAAQSSSHPTYGVNLDSDTNPVFIYVWADDSSGNWLVGTSQWDESSNVTDAGFTPDASSWYRAELIFDAAQNVEMRVWKVGDARPGSPLTSGQMDDVGAPSNNGFPFLDLYYSAINEEDAKFDNFSLTGPFPIGFTVDAVIVDTHRFGSFTADSMLRKIFLSGGSYANTILASSPAAYYRMASTSALTDSSGNGHHGTWSLATPVLANTLLANPYDVADKAVSFVNSPEASVSDSSWWANGDANGNATIEAWVDLAATGAGTHQYIGGLRPASDAANAFYMLQLNGSSSIEFRWRNSSGTAYTGTYAIPGAGVYHLVLTKEGSVLTLYVNGFAQASSGGLTGSINSTGLPTEIGRMADSGVRFTRTMDEVALYARALQIDEINLHYRSGLGLTVSPRLDAVLKATRTGSFTANAQIRRTATGSFTANAIIFKTIATIDAVIRRTGSTSFAADAWIYHPRQDPDGPGEPGETPLVSIIVGGVDITADVMMQEATFTMLVNGAIGTCSLKVRDDSHTWNFTSGAEVTLDIDGVRRFGGYILSPKRMFAFPAEDTTDISRPSRIHVLQGVDYNILMTKRIVRDKSDPNQVELRHWPVGSHDDVVIKYVFDHYTDLAADGVTYSGVTHVGSPNPDFPGVIASGGLTFLNAMQEINRLISAVFYIDAYKNLNYVDVDIPDAYVGLSDRPGVGEVGYRSFTKTNNGAGLVNDAMVWGLGHLPRKFSRARDSASITAHGLWQFGEATTALYKQPSVDMRADTIVYGTEQSLRGGKDDQESWAVTTFNTTFEVGQKVAIESEVFDVSDVVPIRRLTVTFPTWRPQFELLLSHEIDEPWNMFEFFFGGISDPPGPNTPTTDGTGCDCGITDDFERTESGTWGIASCLIPWNTFTTSGSGAVNVTGGMGDLSTPGSGSGANSVAAVYLGGSGVGETRAYVDTPRVMHFQLGGFPFTPSDAGYTIQWSAVDLIGSVVANIFIELPVGFGPVTSHLRWTFGASDGTVVPVSFWNDGTTYTWTIERVGSDMVSTITDGVSTYSVSINQTPTTVRLGLSALLAQQLPFTPSNKHFYVLDINLPEFNLCLSSNFDNFLRTEGSGWGTATPSGFVWQAIQIDGSWSIPVPGQAILALAASGPLSLTSVETNATTGPAPWKVLTGVTMRWLFSLSSGSGTSTQVTFGYKTGLGVGGGQMWVVADFDAQSFYDQDGNDISLTLDPGITYEVEFRIVWGASAGAKTWQARIWDSTTEAPDWQIDGSGGSAYLESDTHPYASIVGSTGNEITAWGVSFTDYVGEPCYYNCVDGDCLPVPPTTSVGQARTDGIGDGTTTVFYTPFGFNYLTTRVFVNGYFQRPGVEYTETDPDNGEITFTTAPADGAEITFLYEANGPT